MCSSDLAVLAQSNALSRVANPARVRTPVQNQAVALGLFGALDGRIAPWLDALEAQAAALPEGQAPPPGAAPMDPEKKKELLRLCEETRGTHELIRMGLGGAGDVLPDAVRPDARASFTNLKKILDLLREKDNQQQNQQQQQQNQQQQQQNQQQQQQQNQQQNQQQQDQQNQQDRKDQQDKQQQQQSPESSESSQSPDADEEPDAEPAKLEEKDPDEEAAQAIIKMILEQEKKREAAVPRINARRSRKRVGFLHILDSMGVVARVNQ